MRYSVAALSLVGLSGVALGRSLPAEPSDVHATIDRGLKFLVKDAQAWKDEHKCVSCHHASQMIWSMREAKQRGFAVDEPFLAELTKWVAEAGDGKTGVERPASAPRALNTKAVYFALALGANAQPDAASQEAMKLLWKTVEDDQLEDGSWSAWPETRPPFFGESQETMTVLAALAMTPGTAISDDAAKAARDRGVKWLTEKKTDTDPQSVALRLVLWQRLGRPVDELEPLVRSIRERQNADGGWSQTKEMASDAWATGQALYALAQAGVKLDDPAPERGRAFLIKTQREDGSWPMTSRPLKPGDTGAKNLVPITGGGSAWAILGLVQGHSTRSARRL
jgi:hypothetical protein